ncbi:MAG TPA: hypothetical protein VFE46_13400 [Pirellulales bacterium]|nr:hypothetical protein [Pirellulales bacterium]
MPSAIQGGVDDDVLEHTVFIAVMLLYPVPPLCTNRWIERFLYRAFAWWRWRQRLSSLTDYHLNVFRGNHVRVLVSDPNNRGKREVYIERLTGDKQWKRIAAVREEEFSIMIQLMVDAFNFIRTDSVRWQVVPR